MTEREELKPCKCGCGGRPVWNLSANNPYIYSESDCGTMAQEETESETVAAWNRRAEV